MEEKDISERESLLLIRQMIQTAKTEQKDDGRGWIMWGIMLFLASVLTIFNQHYKWVGNWDFWNAFGIITLLVGLYEIISYLFFRKTKRVRTYTKDLFDKLNIGFFISLVFVIISINLNKIHPDTGFSFLISLYAFWILIYGSALDFKPSIVAAFITWGLGFASLFSDTFAGVMWFHALAALIGYIIPGLIANRQFKKLHSKDKVIESV
jgi:hypothetical protein